MLKIKEWIEVRRLKRATCFKYRQGRRQYARRLKKIREKYRKKRSASAWRLAF